MWELLLPMDLPAEKNQSPEDSTALLHVGMALPSTQGLPPSAGMETGWGAWKELGRTTAGAGQDLYLTWNMCRAAWPALRRLLASFCVMVLLLLLWSELCNESREREHFVSWVWLDLSAGNAHLSMQKLSKICWGGLPWEVPLESQEYLHSFLSVYFVNNKLAFGFFLFACGFVWGKASVWVVTQEAQSVPWKKKVLVRGRAGKSGGRK